MGAGASSKAQRIDQYASDSEASAAAHVAKGGSLYAVAIGHTLGVYTTWAECQAQVAHFKHGNFRSFNGENALKTAKAFVEEHAKPTEFGRAWVGHEYLKLNAEGASVEAAPLGAEGDEEGDSEQAEAQEEKVQVERPSAEECSRHGLSIEGLEEFLRENEEWIDEDTTVLDVCHTLVMPLTMAPGWDDQPELLHAQHRRYAHRYRPRDHPTTGWNAVRHHEKIHSAARRLHGWHHPSGLSRADHFLKHVTGGQSYPPPGTRSYCEELLAEREEAQVPLRRLLADIPHMKLKELQQALKELPLTAHEARKDEALAAGKARVEALEHKIQTAQNMEAAARLTGRQDEIEAAADQQVRSRAELRFAKQHLEELEEDVRSHAEHKRKHESAHDQKPTKSKPLGPSFQETLDEQAEVHRQLREAKLKRLMTVEKGDRATDHAETEEERRQRYATERRSVAAFAKAGKGWDEISGQEPEPEPEQEPEGEAEAVDHDAAEIERLFKELDADESGFLNRDEVRQLATKLGATLSDEELAAAMEEMDPSGDDQVDLHEFSSWWRRMMGMEQEPERETSAEEQAKLDAAAEEAARATADEEKWSELRKLEVMPGGLSESDQARWERERKMQTLQDKEAATERGRRERAWLKATSKLPDETIREIEAVFAEARDTTPMPQTVGEPPKVRPLKESEIKKWKARRELVKLQMELAFAVRAEQAAEAAAPDPATHVGEPNVLLCHAALLPFRDVVAAARSMVDGCDNPALNGGPSDAGGKDGASPARLYFWFDIFCTDQHKLQESCVDVQGWAQDHADVVKKVGHTALVLSPKMWDAPKPIRQPESNRCGTTRWHPPVALLRSWCLWELFCTAQLQDDCAFSVLVGGISHAVPKFEAALLDDFEAVLLCFTRTIDVEMSETGAFLDRDMLLQAVGEANFRGRAGLSAVTDALVHHLHAWCVRAARGAVTARAEPGGGHFATQEAVFAGWRVAGALQRQGMLPEARDMWKLVVLGYTRLEGQRSRNALAAQHALTHLYLESGESDATVEDMLWKLLEKETKSLGERHMDTANTRRVLGVLLRKEGKQVVARDMARPLREDRAVVQSVQDAEWEEQKLKRAKEMRELRELKNNPLLATSVDKRVSAQTEIEEKRLARHAEVDSLTKQTELTAWQEQIKMNQDVQRRAKVVERVSLEEEEAVKKRFDDIEREALADLSVML
jgi:hypothetical protein